MAGPNPSTPRRKNKRGDRSELPLSFLPRNNPRARHAYIAALIGLTPVVGLLAGVAAIALGWLGYRAGKTLYKGDGVGHSVVSMALGAAETLTNGAGLWLIGLSQGWI